MAVLLAVHLPAWAADNAVQSGSMGSMVKVMLGLIVVLAVMALVSWIVKRMLPGGGNATSIMKVVASTGVGSRERVVVLEIADRWLVVGVAPGQVSALANLEIGSFQLSSTMGISKNLDANTSDEAISTANVGATVHPSVSPMLQPLVKPFAEWMKKSMLKK